MSRYSTLLLLVLVVVLYGWTIPGPFVLDDLRNVARMDAYHAGRADQLNLFGFARGPEDIRQMLLSGVGFWQLHEAFRANFWRPLAEWSHYLDFVLFGTRAPAHRAGNVLIYALCVWLGWRLYRILEPNRKVAIWAAVFFTLTSSHIVPVVFISNRSDLLALLFTLLAVQAYWQFRLNRRGRWLLAAVAGYGLALACKEAALPVVGIFLLIEWLAGLGGLPAPGECVARRVSYGLAFVAVALVYVGFYFGTGHGANSIYYLDPIHQPWRYLQRAPQSLLLLVSSFITGVNPIAFAGPQETTLGWVHVAVMTPFLAWLAAVLAVYHRHSPNVKFFAGWMVLFVPVVLCSTPDERVLTLASVGWAYLLAVVLAMARESARRLWARRGVRVYAFIIGVLVPAIALPVNVAILFGTEKLARENLSSSLQAVPLESGDVVFLLNSQLATEPYWSQYRLRFLPNVPDGLQIYYLSCLQDGLRVEQTSANSLELSAEGRPFFATYLEMLSRPLDQPFAEGETFRTRHFVARVLEIRDGQVRTCAFEFDRPLADPRFHFLWFEPAREARWYRPLDRLRIVTRVWRPAETSAAARVRSLPQPCPPTDRAPT